MMGNYYSLNNYSHVEKTFPEEGQVCRDFLAIHCGLELNKKGQKII